MGGMTMATVVGTECSKDVPIGIHVFPATTGAAKTRHVVVLAFEAGIGVEMAHTLGGRPEGGPSKERLI